MPQGPVRHYKFFYARTAGFTLLEMLVVITMLGILAAIVAPGWLTFIERWRLSSARSEVYSAIRRTQVQAQTQGMDWQFSIRENPAGEVEWAIHALADSPAQWRSLGSNAVDIDMADTTLDSRNGAYYVKFDYRGYLASRTRTLTLTSRHAPTVKRCVVMSTLLGAVRQAQDQKRPSSSGRYCY